MGRLASRIVGSLLTLGRASSLTFGLTLGAACSLAALTACHSGSPELRVVGVHEEARHDVVFVQVTNPASHVMRLTKLEYTFAADGAKVSEGELSLGRDVPAGAAVVVEIPLDSPSAKPLTLSGKLTAELNEIVQIFSVSAQVDPSKQADPTR
jgi:hypothetical protein